jgi:hypothetical protein
MTMPSMVSALRSLLTARARKAILNKEPNFTLRGPRCAHPPRRGRRGR